MLISAGIGITPIAAIIEDVSRRQHRRTVRFYHADASRNALSDSLLRQLLAMRDARARYWYEHGAEEAPASHSAQAGFMNLRDADLPEGARAFLCGPLPFMQAIRSTLLSRGVPKRRNE